MIIHPEFHDLYKIGQAEHDAWRVRGTNFVISDTGNGGDTAYCLVLEITGHELYHAATLAECYNELIKIFTEKDHLLSLSQRSWRHLAMDEATPDSIRRACAQLWESRSTAL